MGKFLQNSDITLPHRNRSAECHSANRSWRDTIPPHKRTDYGIGVGVTSPASGVGEAGTSVTERRYRGSGTRVVLSAQGTEIAALIPAGQPVPAEGSTAAIAFDPGALHLMGGA